MHSLLCKVKHVWIIAICTRNTLRKADSHTCSKHNRDYMYRHVSVNTNAFKYSFSACYPERVFVDYWPRTWVSTVELVVLGSVNFWSAIVSCTLWCLLGKSFMKQHYYTVFQKKLPRMLVSATENCCWKILIWWCEHYVIRNWKF